MSPTPRDKSSNLHSYIASVEGLESLKAKKEVKRRIQKAFEEEAIELDLSGFELKSIDSSICQLSKLKKINLSQNQLTTVPKELGQLSSLTRLDLSQNQLTTVPKELGQLSQLTWLSFKQNELTTVPKELGQLSSLTKLDLSQNQLTTVPKELGQLSQLTWLSFKQNELTTVPKELGQLSNLTRLFLSHNQLITVPKELGLLSNLTYLYLSYNQLTTVPNALGKLRNLTALYLTYNQLTTVPKGLGQLSNLIVLYLSHNQLTTVPKELGQLSNLTELYLDHNRLTTMPKELGQLNKLEQLYLHDNIQMNILPEVLGPTADRVFKMGATAANPQDIFNYLFRIGDDFQPLNEAKLIVVGFGAVGKTSLVNRLIHHTFDPKEKKTDGIQITQWPMRLHDTEDITLHVWDFGGQEIMHSTHQFFFTERSLYLLVLNGRQGHEDIDADYWLELIQSFGGDSPVIVVLNKIKDHPFDVNRRALQDKFRNIREFVCTDCEANYNINTLRTVIEREGDQLENLRVPFPASWVTIKDRLAEMDENYISFEHYRSICQKDGETDSRAQDSLAVHLHSLGIALNYKDDPRLRDTHVLNPHWVTNGIYTLLNSHKLEDSNGELEAACLTHILDSQAYPPERHGFLLELMRKFELCFRFEEDENRFLIPDLLDKQQPPEATEFDPIECLNFRYEYPILPEGLLPRFIVRTYVLSDHQLRWRTGVILTFEGNRALVKADLQDRCIIINVNGAIESRRRLLAIIRYDFERIHASFTFKPKELVPVPGHPEVAVKYKELLAREKQGRRSFEVFLDNEDLLDLDIQDLLNGIDFRDSHQFRERVDRSECPLRLFYSYSHKDEVLRDKLDTHLKILERQNLIQTWHDRCINPGSEWSRDIETNLNQADIILLLISAHFISSDYCYQIELPYALKRHEANEAVVIPIIIRPVDWKASEIAKLGVLPTDGTPVTTWTNSDAAWFDVEQGIKKIIETRMQRR